LRISDCGSDVCSSELPENMKVLQEKGFARKLYQGDFLSMTPAPLDREYDRVIMNPPFERRADIRHVNHASTFLKPNGLLVSVMSAGLLYRQDGLTRDFRDLVRSRSGLIEELPEGSFKESGTMFRTVLVAIPGEERGAP